MVLHMEISDCPFAVGTPEHSEWIAYVYIPAVNHQRMAEDGAKVGAESQGRKVIHGHSHNPDGTPKESVFTYGGSTWTIPPFSFARLEEGDLDVGLYGDFSGRVGLSWSDHRSDPLGDIQSMFFDDLPEVSGARYTRGGQNPEANQ